MIKQLASKELEEQDKEAAKENLKNLKNVR